MQNILVERYEHNTVGYQGWIEPEDRSWIVFVADDGTPVFFPHREEDGAVIGDATSVA